MAWSPDDKRIASASSDNTVQIWDAATGSTLVTYTGHARTITDIAWSPDSRRIVSASLDDTAQVWDAATGGNVYIYRGHFVPPDEESPVNHIGRVNAVTWSPGSTLVASGSNDATVQVWKPQ